MRAIGHSGTILHPFGFWQENGTSPNLLQSFRFPKLQLLHNDLMLQNRIWGRGSGRCVPWVTLYQTLSRLDVGANTGDAILHNLCMLLSQTKLEVCRGKRYLANQK